jgi:hypothetical protein
MAELEAKYGYDTKHGMHLVRLLKMGEEILSGQGVIVKRPDAMELLDIRAGMMSYDALLEYAGALEEKVKEAARKTTLPWGPDSVKIDAVLVEAILSHNGVKNGW